MQDNILFLPNRQAPAEPGWVAPNNLPAQLTPFIGREAEVAAVCALLRRPEVRLVTLTGTGGVGKTRLAFQVAADLLHAFPDGVFFVSLAPISEPDLVLPTIAQTFALKETPHWSPLEHLNAYLREKQLLLLLDNFEQVVAASPLLVGLLQVCADLKLLITSRLRLRVSGEYEFPVQPLAVPDPKYLPEDDALMEYAAIALFVQRARALKPDFQLTETNTRPIAEICTRLDGLPLAIELAAARIKLLSPQALLARLSQRLQVLTSGARNLPARQQTLRNTIQWSYDLLDAQEQRLFRQLSVFVGGCTLEAVEAISAALGDETKHILDVVSSLIDKSLLQQVEQMNSEPRLVMLETIREYGLECLAASGEMEIISQAHAECYLAFAEEGEPKLTSAEQIEWLERLEWEHDNLRAALSWFIQQGEVEAALRLGAALMWFWIVRGHLSEGMGLLNAALADSSEIAPAVRAKALSSAGWLAQQQGDLLQAVTLSEESLKLFRELGDKEGIAFSLKILGIVARIEGDLLKATTLCQESLVLAREEGNIHSIADSLLNVGISFHNRGDYSRAYALLEESHTLFKGLGDSGGIAYSLHYLARALFLQGNYAPARAPFEESLSVFREMGNRIGIADTLPFLAQVVSLQGDQAMARRLLEESLVISKETGHQFGIASSFSVLGRLTAAEGDYVAARTFYEQSLAIANKMIYKLLVPLCLEELAGAIAAQGETVWAAELWGAAEALREVIGVPIPPIYRADYEQAVMAARTQGSAQLFASAWAHGCAMTPEQVLAAQGPVTIPQQVSEEPQQFINKKSSSTYPAGLTEREMEVLRLVAQGLTNTQIAERLIISSYTVNAHVRSIFNKLDVNSRNAVTRFAIEQKLM